MRYTQSKDGKIVYAFLFKPTAGPLTLGKINFSHNMSVTLLGSKAAIKVRAANSGINLELPQASLERLRHVWVLKITR